MNCGGTFPEIWSILLFKVWKDNRPKLSTFMQRLDLQKHEKARKFVYNLCKVNKKRRNWQITRRKSLELDLRDKEQSIGQ